MSVEVSSDNLIRWGDDNREFKRTLITTTHEFNRLLWKLEDAPIFAYDTETNGEFDRFKVGLVGMSFCCDDDEAFYLPLMHDEGDQLPIVYCLERLAPIFRNREKEKICHNAKFDEMVLSAYDIDVAGAGNCTYVMAWMTAEDASSKGLKPLILKHYGVEMETYEDVIYNTPKKKGIDRDYSFARVTLEAALSYAADDAYYAWRLYHDFKHQLESENLWTPYVKVERPFTRVLRKLEAKGVYIDQDYLNKADEKLPKIIEQVEAAIYEEAGEVFNIGSPKQLGQVLFERLKIGNNVPLTKSGNYATDKKTLEIYAGQHEIVSNVLRRKKIQKTHSTFVQSTRDYIGKDGRVHPSFNGSGTVTGRLSCSSPNLQQIEGDEVEEIKVRNFFVPEPGNRFIVADYGQIELRIMAHLAQDKAAIKAFNSGRDFHDETARLMYHLGPDDEVIHRQRFTAKSLNFGIPYGRGSASVAELLGIEDKCLYWPQYDKKLLDQGTKVWYQKGEMRDTPCMDCAQCFIDKWWEAFPQVKDLKTKTLERAKNQGFIRTISGRKRRLPDIRSGNIMLRSRAQRQAFNTVIQGSAADIIKLAMVALDEKLPEYDAGMCVQIHDELIIECPTDLCEEALETVRHIMENPVNGKNPLRLPLVVDPKIVDRWGDAK